MKINLNQLPLEAEKVKKENKKYFSNLKRRTPKNLDYVMQELHEEAFEEIDCLSCGNCCKTTSPIFTEKDIERIAKHLKMKVADFTKTYLQRDQDEFMVLQSSPCTFLDESDNTCLIYDVRPKACAEYPHTNRKKFIQITNLTIANTTICPATFAIVEKLKTILPLQSKTKQKR